MLIIGLRSHFQSAWVKYDFHKICDADPYKAPCPDIAMERFYVAITVICFLFSVIGLIVSVLLVNPYNKIFWICVSGINFIIFFKQLNIVKYYKFCIVVSNSGHNLSWIIIYYVTHCCYFAHCLCHQNKQTSVIY